MPPIFSKPLAYNLTQFLFKSRKRQVISSSILAIVLLLIKLRLTKGSTDNLKVKPKKNKKVARRDLLIFREEEMWISCSFRESASCLR